MATPWRCAAWSTSSRCRAWCGASATKGALCASCHGARRKCMRGSPGICDMMAGSGSKNIGLPCCTSLRACMVRGLLLPQCCRSQTWTVCLACGRVRSCRRPFCSTRLERRRSPCCDCRRSGRCERCCWPPTKLFLTQRSIVASSRLIYQSGCAWPTTGHECRWRTLAGLRALASDAFSVGCRDLS